MDFVIFIHGIDVWNIKNNLHKKALKRAAKVVSVSEFTTEKIKNQVPEIKNKQFILPNTVNPDKFYIKTRPDYLVKKYNLENKKIIFLLARLSKSELYKGYDKVVRSLPKVVKELPETVFILGGKGDDRERIEKLVKELELKNNVILVGYIPDSELINYYNLADVFVMPSKKEGFGIVFLESLACGTPVIAGNKDGSVDPLQNGKTGLLIDPDDINSIASALISVLSSKVKNKNIISPEYLRNQTINEFGFNEFKKKLNILLYEL